MKKNYDWILTVDIAKNMSKKFSDLLSSSLVKGFWSTPLASEDGLLYKSWKTHHDMHILNGGKDDKTIYID